MPRLWQDTIEAHRRDLHGAILDTAADLVTERGLLSVTMSQIAQATGIGRATLYKYFSDVEAILAAWHERQVSCHLEQLAAARDQEGDAYQRLEAVLEAFAFLQHDIRVAHCTELAAHLHRGEHVAHAQHHVRGLVRDLVADAGEAGDVRSDVVPDELANYCLHALTAANDLSSKAAVRRLVQVTLAGLCAPA